LEIPLKGACKNLQGIDSSEALLESLEQKVAMESYTQDGEHYYRLAQVISLSDPKRLTFQEASSKGILDSLLDAKLKAHHELARAASPQKFLNEDGSAKDFMAVRHQIGSFVYKDLLAAIEKDALQHSDQLKKEDFQNSLDLYATHRFYQLARKAEQDIRAKGSLSLYLEKERPCHLEETLQTVKRKDKMTGVGEEIFAMEEQAYSPLHLGAEMSFYQVVKKRQMEEESFEEAMEKGRQSMILDAKRYLMTEVLQLLKSKGGIYVANHQESGV